MMTKWHKVLFHGVASFVFMLFLSHCASSPNPSAPNDVLEPVTGDETSSQTLPPNPTYQKLMEIFQGLGYEGFGMQFESEATLEILVQAFSNPHAANRQIRLVYTGLATSYEPKAQSLTIGGLRDANAVLAFIEKHVPLKPHPTTPE